MTDRITTDAWARAKIAYLAGETAGGVCARFRIGRSAFFAAAQAGGWLRRDQAAGRGAEGGGASETSAPPGEALPCVDLAEAAMARASDAVMNGRLHEAQGWTRLAAELRRLALEETGQETWREALGHTIDQEAHGHYMADRLADAPDSPDSLRTPDVAVTCRDYSVIRAEPDSVDCPPHTGLRTTAALAQSSDPAYAWMLPDAARACRVERVLQEAGP